MKKFLAMLLAITMLFSLCACGDGANQTTDPSSSGQAAIQGTENPNDGAEGTTGTTQAPTDEPTNGATGETTAPPTEAPTAPPTQAPTEAPTAPPTEEPTTPPTTCSHSWKDATCSSPKTCSKCGVTEGNAKGHSWSDATCTAPKTCKTCGATDGSAKGHSWSNATCTAPKTCKTCGATEGNAKGHSLSNATCTAPKTCKTCGATEGSAAGHNWTDATCTAPKTCKACGATDGAANGHSWQDATCTAPKTCKTCGATEGNAKGHNMPTDSNYCTICGEFEYNKLRATRGCVDSSASYWDTQVEDSAIDSFEIMNVYYIASDNCGCANCDDTHYEDFEKNPDATPYISVFIVIRYYVDGVENCSIEIYGVHKYRDEVADTYYLLTMYNEPYWYYYDNTSYAITTIYAQDYSYYYEENDLVKVNLSELMKNN